MTKKDGCNGKKIWWISIFVVAISAYTYGMITVKYRIFPYQTIKYTKDIIFDGRKKSLEAGMKGNKNYYYDKKSFFEVSGAKSDIVMVGASITDHAEWRELFSNISIVNRGISGDTTKGVLNRMESIYLTNAKKAFIMVGLNDLGKGISIDEILHNYRKIVFQLKQHKIKPYIQSVLLLSNKDAPLNKQILKLNSKLRAFSEEENIVFIDLNKVLSKNGRLMESYSSEDNTHLNGYGYLAWKNAIKKYVE